ncbi:MAG: hypothetical protein PHO30_00935 [Candidatus Omnitrophica bacterium]|nr:hypothetical protein [Candidatus Omnitrophota bacterium]
MKYFWMAVLFLLLGTSNVFSQDASGEVPFPKNLTVVLPKDGTVTMDWIAAPLSAEEIGKTVMRDVVFRIDQNNNVWLGYNQKYLANLGDGLNFSLGQPVRDFVFLDDGALCIVTETSLGFIPPIDNNGTLAQEKGIPVFPFQPLCSLPLKQCGIVSNNRGSVYIYGYDPAMNAYAVYELLYEGNKAYHKGEKNLKGWGKVFLSSDKISAVAAVGGEVYVAAGRRVFKIVSGQKEPVLVLVHPREAVTGLAAVPDGSIVYATGSGAGLIKSKMVMEFLKYPSVRIAQQKNDLLVFLPDNLGVLKLTNMDKFITRK